MFYGARSGREGKPGGSKDLDQYVSNSRTISFRKLFNLLFNWLLSFNIEIVIKVQKVQQGVPEKV